MSDFERGDIFLFLKLLFSRSANDFNIFPFPFSIKYILDGKLITAVPFRIEISCYLVQVLAIAIDENYNRSKLHASRTPETLKILKTSVVNQWKLFIPRWTVSNLSIFVAPICTTKRDIRRTSSFPIGRRKSLVYPIPDPFLRAITKQILVSSKQKLRSFRFWREKIQSFEITW